MNSDLPLAANVMPFPAARSGALHSHLVGDIRRLINEGDLKPGSRIQEKTLCERFSVSRTPLREALKVLAVEGLITLLPRRGARVASLDETQLQQVFEVVAALEAEAGRLACGRIDDAGIADIQALHHRMRAHYLRGELSPYFATNQQIHAAIVAAADNPILTATHATLAGRILRPRYLANRLDTARWHTAVAEHEAILAALQQRDAERLAMLLSAHLMNKQNAILAQLREQATGVG